jgi:branched-chain amino acid transport system substrate-binding protein
VKHRVAGAFPLVAAASLLLLSGCSRQSEEVRIGLIAMLSGPNAANGRSMSNAATLAVSEINRRGGLRIEGSLRPVKLIEEDDHNSPEAAIGAARTLVYKARVAAIVGPQFSANAIPVARFAESVGIVMVAPMSTNPETTAGKRFVFRIPYLDTFQGRVLARFAREELKAGSAALLYDVAGDYNRTLADVFRETFVRAGGVVTAVETYTTNENMDFTVQLRKIARGKPDVLFLPNYSADVQRQADQARAMGITAVLLGGDGWDPERFASDLSFDGSFSTRHWDPFQEGAMARAFLAGYRQAYGSIPGDVAATTSDAMGLLFAGMEKAGSIQGEAVRQSISGLAGFEGVTGSIAYGATGDPVKSAVIIGIKGGKGSVHAVIQP